MEEYDPFEEYEAYLSSVNEEQSVVQRSQQDYDVHMSDS